MRERNFGGLADARRIFNSHVARAKNAMAADLETIKATNTEAGGKPARAVQVAAIREYERALLEAFDEYLEATTDDVPEDQVERERWAKADLARRLDAAGVAQVGRFDNEGSREPIGGSD